MDIRTLDLFCELVETQSFSETARRQSLTQSAVSHKLNRLEKELECKLVVRGHGDFRLTEKGKIFLHYANRILAQYRQLMASLAHPLKAVGGQLRVAAMYTVGLYELPPFTIEFLNRYPKVNLQLRFMHTAEIYDALHAGKIDIGIVDYPTSEPLLRQEPFTVQRLVLVVPSGHPFSGLASVSLRQLEGQPFISSPKELPRHQFFDRLFKKHKVKVRVVHTFDNIEVVKRAIISGVGISIIPEISVREDVQAGRLAAIEIDEGPLDRPIGILTHKDTELAQAAIQFIQLLQNYSPE